MQYVQSYSGEVIINYIFIYIYIYIYVCIYTRQINRFNNKITLGMCNRIQGR